MRSSESAQLYQQAYQRLPDKDKEAMSTSLAKQGDHALATVAYLSMDEDQPMVAQTVALGAKYRDEIEKLYKGHPKSDNKFFDTHYTPLVHKHLSSLQLNSLGSFFERSVESIKLYIMGNMKMTGKFDLNSRVVEEAIKQVLGNVPISVNGNIVMPPRGMGEEEFKDRLWIATKSAGEFNPYWSHYMNVGGGRYVLVEHGNPKLDKEGNPIIINPRSVPTNKVREANEERRRERDLRIWEGQVFDQGGVL